MRLLGSLLLLTGLAFSQRAGHPGGAHSNSPGAFGSKTGFGNVVYPGTGHAPNLPGVGVISDPSFASRLGATVSGYPPYRGGGGRNGRGVVYVPYGYPVYGYQGGYEQPPQNVTVVYPPAPSPQVVINQNFVPENIRPVVREYATSADGIRVYETERRPPAETPESEENKSFLIAFKDHTIYSAIAYWVDGDTLHYVAAHNTHNQVSLDLVDRELSERLNRERSVSFRLPAKPAF